jgi:hypothetical protein
VGKIQLVKVTYIRVGLGRSHESPALMHTSLTRWAAKSFRLHGRRIIIVISRTFSNSDGMRRNEMGSGHWLEKADLETSQEER